MKRLFFSLVCMAVAVCMTAQPGTHTDRNRHQFSPERYKQRLEEFVTREASLTADESQKLFPMLHEMMEKQRKNSDAARQAMQSCKDNLSEADYEKAVNKALDLDLENKRIEKEYYQKFHSALPWQKVHAVRIALWKFQMEALRRFTPHGKKGPGKPRNN